SWFVRAFKVDLVFIESLAGLSGLFVSNLPHFEVVVSYHRHAFHRTQPDPPRPVRAFGVVPLDDDLAVDLNFNAPADLQNTKAMCDIGRASGQARAFGHCLKPGFLRRRFERLSASLFRLQYESV